MADSDAVRQQRSRRHKAGDHSACRRDCAAGRASPGIAALPAASGEDLDPAAALRDLAAALCAAYAADPGNALLAREARATLLAVGAGGEEADPLADLAALLSTPVPYEPVT